ncbi:MAG TPA: hypothetical protein VFD32_09825 [Dehalococcoidia bacterium]|nr:hypothetical protein [Dehalococcoidia bacterium]
MLNGIRRWLARLRGEDAADQDGAVYVIGLLPNDSDAEIALNNLAEADFAARQISVLTTDPLRTAALTDTPGSWGQQTPDAAVERMRSLGVAEADRAAFRSGLDGGGVLIVIRTRRDTAAAAEEMLRDQQASLVRSVDERRTG